MLAHGVVIQLPQQAHALMDFVDGSTGDCEKECNIVFQFVNLIKEQKVRHVVDKVEHVVDTFREFIDVFSIKWRNE